MKLVIDIPDYNLNDIQNGSIACGRILEAVKNGTPLTEEVIKNGISYDKVIDEVTELLENEWGYEGMRDDIARIMKGATE